MTGEKLETAITASVILLLFIVPTASQSVEFPEEGVSESPIVSSESNMDMNVDLDSGKSSVASIEKHGTHYKISERPSKRTEVLKTPEAVLKIKYTNNTILKKLESPYGDLKTGLKDGRRVSSFEGANRTKSVKLMRELSSSAKRYRDNVKQEMAPEVDLSILKERASDDNESVLIENEGSRSLELSGWTLINSDGDKYTFEDLEVPAHGEVVVFNKQEKELDIEESPAKQYIYDTGIDWDGTSDDASLFNLEGLEIAEDSY